MKARLARLVVALAPLLFATGCALEPDYAKLPVSASYPVGHDPSPECREAAGRATYWCERATPRSDPNASGKCSKARWEHARAC